LANDIGIIVITNQAGISKGYTDITEFNKMNKILLGLGIIDIFYRAHSKEKGCTCRKPSTGMLTEAAKKYNIIPEETYFIGDSDKDIKAGNSFGCKTVLVLTFERNSLHAVV